MICIYSRRAVWITAASAFAIIIIALTMNMSNVSANITTRRSIRKYRIIPCSATQNQQQQQQQQQQQDPSILVRAIAKQASDIIPNAISKIKTKTSSSSSSSTSTCTCTSTSTSTQQQAPEGIYVNKPVLRGQFHKWGAILFPPFLALPLCLKALRTATTNDAPNAFRSCLLYCFAVEVVMVISGTLHTFRWKTEEAHQTARKLDFTGIFLGIACSYSSLGRFVLGAHPYWNTIERTVWTCAILGTLMKWKVPDAPHWANASIFLVQGWATIPLFPYILFSEMVSRTIAVSIVAGGIFVTLGALAYSLQWPYNRHQKAQFKIFFGPHELFHVGSILTFVTFWFCMWTRISELAI